MKKILIIGEGDCIFLKDFVRQMYNKNILVDLLTFNGKAEIGYSRKQVNILLNTAQRNRLKNKIFFCYAIKKGLGEFDEKYDCIIIHFVHFFLSFFIILIKMKTKNLVLNILGSDFCRVKGWRALLQKVIYLSSNKIVFTNPETKKRFHKKNFFIPKTKLKIARFGLPVLDEINKFQLKKLSREDACKKFGFPEEKIIIAAGYNAHRSQKQTLIIKKFALLPENVRKKGFLVFHLGYGDPSTKQIILSELEKNKILNYSIIDNFLGYADIAELRCCTDVLINIQPSDQFSASMQEVLYSGGRIIAGSWLPYQELIENKAAIRLIDTTDEIGEALALEISAGKKQHLFPQKSVIEFIDRSSTWKENIEIWANIIFG